MKDKIRQKIDMLLDSKDVVTFTEKGVMTYPLPCNVTEEEFRLLHPDAVIVDDRKSISLGIGHGIKVEGMDKNVEKIGESLRDFFQSVKNDLG